VIGFHRETVAGQMRLRVPLSGHSIDSVNLKSPALGLYEQLAEFVARSDVDKGRLHIALGRGERDAALTINEFETLLMKYDLAAVLKNPLRFMAEEYRQALANPRAVPGKALGYAQYDLVRVLNTGLKTLGLRGSLLERVLARTLAVPVARMFRVRRSISVLVAGDGSRSGPVEGVYQSPILIQWLPGRDPERELTSRCIGRAVAARSDAGSKASALRTVPLRRGDRRMEERDAAQHAERGRPGNAFTICSVRMPNAPSLAARWTASAATVPSQSCDLKLPTTSRVRRPTASRYSRSAPSSICRVSSVTSALVMPMPKSRRVMARRLAQLSSSNSCVRAPRIVLTKMSSPREM
jgi:hypothetical protein